MNSVNNELMTNLLQVTQLSKTFESASLQTTDSDVSFATILNDMSQNGIELTAEEATMYEKSLTDQGVDLKELHEMLAKVIAENEDIPQDEEAENLLDILKEMLEPEDDESSLETKQPINIEDINPTKTEVKPEDNSEVVIPQSNETEIVEVDMKPQENEVAETDTKPVEHVEQRSEIPVEKNVESKVEAGPMQEAETLDAETEDVKKRTVEQVNIDEAVMPMMEPVVEKPATNEVEKEEITIDTEHKETSINNAYDFLNSEEVIISDDSVLKLDLMFKDVFNQIDNSSENVANEDTPIMFSVNEEVDVNSEEATELVTNLNKDMEVLTSDKEEHSDSEIAYEKMNSFRINLEEVNMDTTSSVKDTMNTESTNVPEGNYSWIKEAKEINLTQQITQSFASKSDMDSEFVIKLKPEGIGEIVVKMVSSSDGNTQVSMITNNQHVKALLESDMMDLKNALLNQDVEVKEVVFDEQSSYFSESNFQDGSNANHSNTQHQNFSNYYQSTNDESESMTAPTDRYYESSRLHQYA